MIKFKAICTKEIGKEKSFIYKWDSDDKAYEEFNKMKNENVFCSAYLNSIFSLKQKTTQNPMLRCFMKQFQKDTLICFLSLKSILKVS